jgi:alpha-tubulin suppressor-like RCC1 family protein
MIDTFVTFHVRPGKAAKSERSGLFGFGVLLLGVLNVVVTATAPEPVRFISVTAGADHVCALTDRGEAYCWGSNEAGQLGTGSTDSLAHTRPARVIGDLTFTTLAAGLTHTCGLTRDGAVFCWGANDSAQLGDGTIRNSPTPVRVATDVKFKTIGPGGTHTCAVSVDGVGYCWGGNWHGQLGVDNRDGDAGAPCCYRAPTRIRTELRFSSVVAGGIDSCGVAVDGKAYCWGSPQEGRLGTGAADAANKSADKTVPIAVAGDVVFATVVPRAWHTCGLSSTHAAFCWGGNVFQIGSVVPRRIGADVDFTMISTGLFHDCALSRDGIAYCWGQNADGEIGDGTTHDAASPQRVATDRRFVSIAAGGNVFVAKPGDATTWAFTCGLTRDVASILCWGDNRHGALGNGSTTRALTPTPVSNPE